ncbi:MAG: YigZ family protein [Treponemataceae bacterium]|nr:YigZ family protein [Treponemataceae bacterium]
MLILTGSFAAELTVKGSRFIAEVLPVTTQAEARDTLKAQKTRYADATHVVHAFIAGLGAEVMGMSDDGEPSGTAGRPVLDVLKGRGVTNVLLTVTRYFGGTLLGTGGLVKAYGDSAKLVLDGAAGAGLFEPYVEKCGFFMTVPYELLDKIKYSLQNYKISDMTEEYTEKVCISGQIHADQFERLCSNIREMTNATVIVERL